MDTDSTYITISGDSVESLVKPELRAEFEQDKCNWFPHTREHKAYDKRTPGQNSSGVKRGFCVVNNTMYTYEQVRDAFSYFYKF